MTEPDAPLARHPLVRRSRAALALAALAAAALASLMPMNPAQAETSSAAAQTR